MPRDGSNIYHKPAGTDGVPNFPIESAKYNAYTADVEQDLNLPRPIVAGGTGANNATDALFNVKGEIATQIVTNWDSQVWVPGSFYAASSATGTSPVAGHNFAGQVYIGEALANPPSNQNVILEARDLDNTTPPGALYVRQKKAGVWSAWSIGTVGTLTDAEKTAARQQIYAAPLDALAYNGMQVNGSIDVSQELGTTGRTTPGYFCDGWYLTNSSTATLGANKAPTASLVPGLPGFINVSVGPAQATLTTTQACTVFQFIEGCRVARLAWGTASAQPMTISFWTCHNRTGIYSVAVRNSLDNRSYVTTYTQDASSIWEYKTVTISGDTTGTWAKDNTAGMIIQFPLASGPSNIAPAANTWYGTFYSAAPGQVNGVAATSDVFRLTGVVVLPGIEAPSAARSPLIMRPYDQELLTCQRYYCMPESGVQTAATAGQNYGTVFYFSPQMRAAPTVVPKTNIIFANVSGAITVTSVRSQSFLHYGLAAASSGFQYVTQFTADARL